MVPVFTIAAAVALLLAILRGTCRRCADHLPLGGSELAQLGILFGGGWAACEVLRALQQLLQ